jgi:isoquinoline 1-oxidoreductase beta subunit
MEAFSFLSDLDLTTLVGITLALVPELFLTAAALVVLLVLAWRHRTAFPPIDTTFTDAERPSLDDLQQGVLDLALAVPHVAAESCKASAHVRVGWLRSVYNIFHAFAIGSFIDEIAHVKGADPRDVWLDVIGPPRQMSLADLGIKKQPNYGETLDKHPVDAGRLRNVIERVTQQARWSNRRGRALGLAAHRSFVAYTAVVISVVPDPVRVFRIDDAWISMDAGTVINQERVHAQLELLRAALVLRLLLPDRLLPSLLRGRAQRDDFLVVRLDQRVERVAHPLHLLPVPGGLALIGRLRLRAAGSL